MLEDFDKSELEASRQKTIAEAKERQNTSESQELVGIVDSMSPEHVQRLYDLMTNSGENETYVNQIVKNATWYYAGETELKDCQRLLLAPANGIENVGRFIASLFTQQGRESVANGVKFVFDENFTTAMQEAFEVFYNRLSTMQKTIFVTEVMSSSLLFSAAISRFAGFLAQARRVKTVMVGELGLKTTAVTSAGVGLSAKLMDGILDGLNTAQTVDAMRDDAQ